MLWNLSHPSVWIDKKGGLEHSYHSEPNLWRTKRSHKFCADMATCPVCVCLTAPASQKPIACAHVCPLFTIQHCVHPKFMSVYASMCCYAHIMCAQSHISVQMFIRQWQSVNHCVWEGRQQRENCCPPVLLTVMTAVWWLYTSLLPLVEWYQWDRHNKAH